MRRNLRRDKVEFGYSFQISEGVWERMGVEVTLKQGETPEKKLVELKEMLLKFHKASNPQLYKTGNEAIVSGFGGNGEIKVDKPPPAEQRIADIISQIMTCKELKVLESYKMIAKTNPSITAAYNKKLEEFDYA